MYLFRQFWAILWLADFFQNLIVSRASVNGDLQNGPHLPQSFSTKVAIESGLYIGTWEHFLAGRRSIWQVPARTWIWGRIQDLAGRSPDGPPTSLWPEPGSEARSWVWPESAPDSKSGRFRVQSQKSSESPKSRLFAKTRDFGDFWDFWIWTQIWQIRHPDAYLSSWSELMCTLVSGTTSDSNMCTMHVGHACHTLTQHMAQTSPICCINLVQSDGIARFFAIVRFENNFWNK